MFVILHDPNGRLNRLAIAAWFYSLFGRLPQTMYAPGRYGSGLWFIAFVRPEEYLALPELPEPPGDNPYRGLVDGEDSPLFREIMEYKPKLMPVPL